MKLYKRLLSLLLVCVLLFGAFSTTVSASNEYDLNSLYWLPIFKYGDNEFKGNEGLRGMTDRRHYTSGSDSRIIEFPQELRISYTSSSEAWNSSVSQILFPKGDGFSLELCNLRDRIIFYDADGNEISSRYRIIFNPSVTVILYKYDGSSVTVVPDSYNTFLLNNRICYSISINSVPFDVTRFQVVFAESQFPFGGSRPSTYSSWARQLTFDGASTHVIKRIPEEKGLLKSIISWLSGIKSGITDLFNSIAELPNKLVQGIKSLFVPDESYFDDYGVRWDELLSSRFGAVYEVCNVAYDFAYSILNSMKGSSKYSISFPVVNIPVGNNVNFSFGGWNVPIQVEGLSFFYTACRSVFSVLGTLLFIKGMRRKYDEVMGVSS